ncbi:hypothetical protein WJX81_003135 [Elliptochloris bilobata]|uniref:Calmodulin binding protein-like N-terminal domain-containing protein n=1 Tax=Elliptochloris bilobata TaxID=381761 RepID=A0AAW1RE97_9CHLO
MDGRSGVLLPPDLAGVPSHILEEYVRARLAQFAGAFAGRINPQLSPHVVQQVATECIASLPAPEYRRLTVEERDLQLVFRHDCLSLGCLDPQCVLCEHNPHRRCNVNFAPKYLVNDLLKAKCDAPIRVEIIDRATGVPLGEDIADLQLEMCVLDGNSYDAKCLEAGQERDDDLDACSLLINNKQQPLLVPGSGGVHSAAQKVIVGLSRGVAQLPDLHISDSSEAMLSGRKPPFRLLVRAVATDGRAVNIRHAVSEGFVVATRRTRTAGKVEIPNVDDHVSKLEHMGKETVKKLQDIRGSAVQCGIDISVPDNCIVKVGEFRRLALLAEADGHLRQKLQQVLKLSKEKWDDARDHALRAVVADNRMRIWYADKASMELGLLFSCRLGNVDLERPVGLLQKKSQDGTQTTMEATLMAQQTPSQREQVRQLQPGAVASWWQQGHPGWAIYPIDSEQFMASGALDHGVSVPTEAPPAPPPHAPAEAPYAAGAYPAAYANGGPGAMGPPPRAGVGRPPPAPHEYLPPEVSRGPAAAATAEGAGGEVDAPQRLPARDGGGAGPLPPSGLGPGRAGDARSSGYPPPPRRAVGANGAAQAKGRPSPFAREQGKGGQGLASRPQVHDLLSSVFSSGPLTPAEMSKFTSAGLSGLANFPSIPLALPSGELDALLQHSHEHGLLSAGMGRAPSMGMGKLESMELPDAVAAVAMLHDMGPEARAAATAAANLQRANSGLETMQSIEQALDTVETDLMDRVAAEYMSQRAHHLSQLPPPPGR